jgi:altronate dehydratase small subunit
MTRNAIKLDPGDNVASALAPLARGQIAAVQCHSDPVEQVTLIDDVPFGFKLAVRDIRQGENILKYGMVMGVATCDIKAGAMVHIQNCQGARAH